MEWMIMPLRRYAEFSGRSRRMEFWMFRLFFYIVFVSLIFVAIAGIGLSEASSNATVGDPELGALFWIGAVGAGLWYLGCIVPSVAVCMRRFHDQDKSGWMWLLYFIPYVGSIVIIVFMCIEGTQGPNQYGFDPKGVGDAETFA